MMLAEWQVGQAFMAMLWFTLFFVWIWLLIAVFADIFRSRDLGGLAKALWVVFVIVAPYLGVFVYLIARGHKMSEHADRSRAKHRTRPRARTFAMRQVHRRVRPTSSAVSLTSRRAVSSTTPSSSASRRTSSRRLLLRACGRPVMQRLRDMRGCERLRLRVAMARS